MVLGMFGINSGIFCVFLRILKCDPKGNSGFLMGMGWEWGQLRFYLKIQILGIFDLLENPKLWGFRASQGLFRDGKKWEFQDKFPFPVWGKTVEFLRGGKDFFGIIWGGILGIFGGRSPPPCRGGDIWGRLGPFPAGGRGGRGPEAPPEAPGGGEAAPAGEENLRGDGPAENREFRPNLGILSQSGNFRGGNFARTWGFFFEEILPRFGNFSVFSGLWRINWPLP